MQVQHDPLAEPNLEYALAYEFVMPGGTKVQGRQDGGRHPWDRRSVVNMVRMLNELWGEGSHWAVPLNRTIDEKE